MYIYIGHYRSVINIYWALLLVSEKLRDTNISLNGESEKLGIAYGADWNNCHHVCSARLD
jgi:hypothetical protein